MPATTIMRSYSQQHLFHEVQTGSAKILANLRLGQDNRPRLFSHPEILTAMGFTNGINSPVNLKQGCAETGNAIMQIHAMAAFWVVIENEDLQTIGDFRDFDQCVRAFQACRHKATGDIQFRDDRRIIGFDADDPTLPRAQFEAVVRIQYHEVRRLVRCPLGLTIRQFLEWGDVQWFGERRFRFRGQEVCEQFLIKGGGILEIEDDFGTSLEEEISPTIPFTVCQEPESSGKVHELSRQRQIADQSGTQIICRVWNLGMLAAEFPVPEDSVAAKHFASYSPGLTMWFV